MAIDEVGAFLFSKGSEKQRFNTKRFSPVPAESALSLRIVKLKPFIEGELRGAQLPNRWGLRVLAEKTTLGPDIVIFKPLAKGLLLGA